MEIADNILIQRCKKRDKDAYCLLVERYKKQAYGFAFSYLKNVDDALTISQDAFIRAWNAIKTFKEEESFRSWLFSIIKNLSLNLIKKKNKLRETSLDAAMEESGFDLGDPSDDPQRNLEKKETQKQVWKAIMGLKDEFREIIVLKYFNDLSYKEIAESLDIPEGTVMSRLYRARIELKAKITTEIKRG